MIEREKMISLVRRAQAGEAEAGGEIYEIFYQDIYYFILKTVKEQTLAEDLTQETFIEILQTIGKLEEPAAFVTWSRQIAYHRCTAYFRKRRELLADEDEDGYSVFDTVEEEREEFIPGEALDKEELKKAIQDMIDALPPEQRTALMMRYFQEISVKEIAQIQGVSEGTVKSRLNYGRKAIKQSVEEYEKKNNIKLHCAGVIPLLLWLFRQTRRASAATTAGAAGAAAAAAGAAGASGSAAAATATAVGAKTVGTAIGAKIAAGILAATVAIGGTTAAVIHHSKKEQPSVSETTVATEAPTTLPAETKPVVTEPPVTEPCPQAGSWYGYGYLNHGHGLNRYDMTIDGAEGQQISGTVTVSQHYEQRLEIGFTGTGTTEDGTVRYTLVFDSPVEFVGTITTSHQGIEMVWDSETDQFVFDDFFDVTLLPVDPAPAVLAKPGIWVGEGENSQCWPNPGGHLFRLDITELTETTIIGHLLLSEGDTVEHDTGFEGRGYTADRVSIYEVKLETPRTYNGIVTAVVDSLWMAYHQDTGTLEILDSLYEAATQRQPDPSEGLRFTLNEDGSGYTLTGMGVCRDSLLVIPAEHEGLPVTTIGDNAFFSCNGLTGVILPGSITTLEDYAFGGCENLSSALLPDGLPYIGGGMFHDCTSLTQIDLPASVTGIHTFAFSGCTGLTDTTIPVGVTEIGYGAFDHCTALRSIHYGGTMAQWQEIAKDPTWDDFTEEYVIHCTDGEIPSGLMFTLREDGASYEVTGMSPRTATEVVIPAQHKGLPVTSIGVSAFKGCQWLTKVTIAEGITTIDDNAFIYCYNLADITIPSTVTTIGTQVFMDCNSLTQVTIPEGVVVLGHGAFDLCANLTSVLIPATVTTIYQNPFMGCPLLESITVAPGNPAYHSAGNCLIETERKALIAGCNNSVIPEDGSVTSIAITAFCGYEDLTALHIPASVTELESSSITGCHGLTSLTVAPDNPVFHSSGNCLIETATKTLVVGCGSSVIPDDGSVTAIGDYAFDGLHSLTGLVIPDGVVQIGDDAFYDCINLTEITIPATVTQIGQNVFYYCNSLTDIYYSGTIAQWEAIEKGEDWLRGTVIPVIHCADGDIS